ncbi:MAG TPA: hypothetical protein VGC12_02420 [Methyloradius sp.]
MSWLFSRALAVEYSAANCSDGEPFAQLNVMPTPHKFWRNDKTMEFSKLSQFGLTLRLLTENHGAELLTSYLAAFPVKTYRLLGGAQELKGIEADCGRNSQELLARLDPVTFLWKIPQCSLFADLEWSLEISPRWGSMRNGACYLQQMLVRPTLEKESGLWATPATMDKLPPKSKQALEREATISRPGRSRPSNLRDQVSNSQNWPTPTATDYKGSPSLKSAKSRAELSTRGVRLPEALAIAMNQEVGGYLNPTWVEWLMGWILGWTELKPLATAKSQEWQLQHSNCSLEELALSELAE